MKRTLTRSARSAPTGRTSPSSITRKGGYTHGELRQWKGLQLRMDDARAMAERWWDEANFHVAPDGAVDTLRLTGTGYYEPDCPHRWCDLPGVDHGDAPRRARARGEL